jgi:hypothetical protein
MVPIPTENLEDERAAVRLAQLPFRQKGQFFILSIGRGGWVQAAPPPAPITPRFIERVYLFFRKGKP